ncbi:MAG: hypothetical protein AAGH15_16010 [Myxococcota bacterium]
MMRSDPGAKSMHGGLGLPSRRSRTSWRGRGVAGVVMLLAACGSGQTHARAGGDDPARPPVTRAQTDAQPAPAAETATRAWHPRRASTYGAHGRGRCELHADDVLCSGSFFGHAHPMRPAAWSFEGAIVELESGQFAPICARTSAGHVFCAHSGDDVRRVPAPPAGDMAVSQAEVCLVTTGGEVRCVPHEAGVYADGGAAVGPAPWRAIQDATDIRRFDRGWCVLRRPRRVVSCWGTRLNPSASSELRTLRPHGVVDFMGHRGHACVARSSGQILCRRNARGWRLGRSAVYPRERMLDVMHGWYELRGTGPGEVRLLQPSMKRPDRLCVASSEAIRCWSTALWPRGRTYVEERRSD